MTDHHKLVELLFSQVDEQAFIFLDSDGRIVDWSAGAREIFGHAADDAIGRGVELVFTPEDVQRGLARHELAVARAGGNMEDDRWMLRKDGLRIWVTGVVKALRDEGGELVGFAKVLRNRTDLKTKTESLESELENLKSREDRSRKLFAIIAHELRNPLAPITNVVQLLRSRLGNDQDVDMAIDILERQVNTLTKLVLDLVDATRITHGKVHCEKVRVELSDILREVAEACRAEMESRQHKFWLLLPPTPLVVMGDALRLRQIFTNLVGNAAKYTPNGGTIYLRATRDSNAIVTVEDNGIGIPPEVLPQIFELFSQEEDPEHRTHAGLGIGLALVKDLVRLHGGTVQAKSDGRNKGSIFTVQLPLAD